MAHVELTPDEIKLLLSLFNHVFQKGGIATGDAVMILNLVAKFQDQLPKDEPPTDPTPEPPAAAN